MKFEQFVADKDAIDYESDLDVAEIFTCKVEFKRNSETKGAMREPLRTLTSQANINKLIGTDSGGAMPRAQDLYYRKVGD